MTADRWKQIESLFEAVLEQETDRRASWLLDACPDTGLRREVAELLAASEKAGLFLEEPAQVAVNELVTGAGLDAEQRVGSYRLIREIGRGGMGIVYLAERADGHYAQRVAVKVLRHALDSEDLHQRFLVERQILASLTHENIARLLDGGVTETGQPYLVMSWVDGQPIDIFCLEREPSVEERLRLFIIVCEAVQYAHQKLIVHRDLKPSNIIVTTPESGPVQVKLLDFGIAKLLDPAAATYAVPVTRTGLHLMTPECASPEQVNGAHITTASDVYQLGLLLYRMLTGRHAHEFSTHSLTEIARVVCDEEPLPPSRARDGAHEKIRSKQFRGDLDAIVMKALRKEPERRYASARLLADDIRNFLSGRPVSAHADSVSYRVRKFAKRNMIAVVSSLVFVILIISYALTVTLQQARTARERDRATQYASFLTELFDSTSPFSTQELGPETTLRAFLDQGTQRVRTELDDDPELRASLLRTIGGVYAALGEDSIALALYHEVLPTHRRLHGERSPEYLETLRMLAWSTEDPAAADSLHRRHIGLARSLEGGAGPITAHGLSTYGHFLHVQGQFEEAAHVLEEASTMLENADPETRVSVLFFLAQSQGDLDRLRNADSLLHEAYEIRRNLLGPLHPHTAVIMTHLGIIAEKRGDLDAALRWKTDALAIFEEKLGAQHPYTIAQLNNVAVLVGMQGNHAEEERLHRRVLTWREHHLGATHSETVSSLQNLATSLLRQGRLDEAEPLYGDVRVRYAESLPPTHYLHAFPSLSLADIYLQRAAFEQAEEAARHAADHMAEALPEGHPLLAVALSRLGEALTGQGRYAEAENLLLRASETLHAAEGFATYRVRTVERLVTLYDVWDRPEDAARYRSADH